MPGAGNDPFSGSSIQNVLQHTISPKIVTDGSTGYVVKADLINLDNIYITGDVYRNGSSINKYVTVLPTVPDPNMPSNLVGGSVAIGESSGDTVHGSFTTSVGSGAGQDFQANGTVAIGYHAGSHTQSTYAVAVGSGAGFTEQKTGAVAIGYHAGNTNQGSSSIAIGTQAGPTNQANNSIVINATGTIIQNTTSNSCIITPVRTSTTVPSGFYQTYWNPTTGELIAIVP